MIYDAACVRVEDANKEAAEALRELRAAERAEAPHSGPARLVPMPPSPETDRRLLTVSCLTCGIEEGMYPDSPAGAIRGSLHANAHNAGAHA